MSDDTLTTERVQDLYSWAYAWRTEDGPDEADLSGVRERQRAEFNRWLVAHDAEVRADQQEQDAQIAEGYDGSDYYVTARNTIAAAIRAGSAS